MQRVLILLYGVFAYLLFLAVFSYMAGFLLDLLVPRAINDPAPIAANGIGHAIMIDIYLIALFGFLHSLLARQRIKEKLYKIIPIAAERSTYVIQSSLCLALAMWQWQPLVGSVWQLDGFAALATYFVFAIGVAVVLWSTFLIDHLELFGLRQIWSNFQNIQMVEPIFRTPALYKIVRHPMQLGIVILLFATPHMTYGHLLFASSMTGYMIIGLFFEERSLVRNFGDVYRDYQKSVPMLFPNPFRFWEAAPHDASSAVNHEGS